MKKIKTLFTLVITLFFLLAGCHTASAPEWPGEYKYVTSSTDNDPSIRTEYKYELTVTESDTEFIFDLCVTRTEIPVNLSGIPIDTSVLIGPVVNFSVSKEEVLRQNTITYMSQKFPDTAPELVEYIELKKDSSEDIISLRYAASEEGLKEKEFVVLNKQ